MEPAKSNPASLDNKLHFLDYWRIIRIRKTVILAVFLLVVLTTTAVTFILPKSYMATARIAVDKDTSDIASMLGVQAQGPFDPYFIQTEFEKIQAQTILDEVIELENLNQKWGKQYGVDTLKTQETREKLKGMIDVSQSRNTSLIEIRVYSESAQEAADIANRIAEVYQKSRVDKMKQHSEKGIEALQERLEAQNQTVKELQTLVDDLRNKHKIADIDSGSGLPGSPLDAETVRFMERQRVEAEQNLIHWESLLKNLEPKTHDDLIEVLPSVFPNERLLVEYKADLSQAEQRFAILAQDAGPDNPEFKRVAALIKTLNEQIDHRVNGVMDALRAQVTQYRDRSVQLEAEVEKAKTTDAERLELFRPYYQARRDLETQQKIRDNIMFRIIQETVDKSLPKESVVEITDFAEARQRAVRPNIPLNITLGVVVGLVMGIGLAFFIEYLDTSVKTIDDVERALQAPVLGVIPQNVGSLLEEGPESPHAEAYRVLRTNILFSRKNPDANTVTVVSGGAGEGKSTTIFNLATIFAQNGQNVLVVDSDLRRPSLHKFLNVSNTKGLTNYLLKQNTLEEVVQTTAVPTLHFLPSGKLPSSSMGILNSAAMKEFIQAAKQRYDFVFFDSPPIMGVSDASILASAIDLALLVVQYRKYPQVMTLRAKQMVEKVGGNMLGVVLNNINISQDSYYYYYSGYYYDYYYSKSDGDKEKKSSKNGESKGPQGEGHRATSLDIKQKY